MTSELICVLLENVKKNQNFASLWAQTLASPQMAPWFDAAAFVAALHTAERCAFAEFCVRVGIDLADFDVESLGSGNAGDIPRSLVPSKRNDKSGPTARAPPACAIFVRPAASALVSEPRL